MKKFIALTTVLVLMSGGIAFAQISGSLHDFNAWAPNNELCAPCHTPHNAIADRAPLWAHIDSAGPFQAYTSPTMDMTVSAVSNISMACLSCHDGTTFMDGFIGSLNGGGLGTAANTMTLIAPTGVLGLDLTNDHPIGITYNVALDADFKTLANAKTAGAVFYGTGADVVECASCHVVHDDAGTSSMLRISNASSALCLACHTK